MLNETSFQGAVQYTLGQQVIDVESEGRFVGDGVYIKFLVNVIDPEGMAYWETAEAFLPKAE